MTKSMEVKLSDAITLVCPSCSKRVDTPRCATDPPKAVELHGIVCPDCDNGGFDLPSYFDAQGVEIDADPMEFMEDDNGRKARTTLTELTGDEDE